MMSHARAHPPPIPDAKQECPQIFYGDVRLGTIAKRIGIPNDQPRWGWSCGFYPGSDPGDCTNGSAATFLRAISRLPGASVCQSDRGDFQERDQQESTERKYTMRTQGERMPSQKPTSLIRCTCAQVFDTHRLEETVIHVPHITAARVH